MPTIGRSGSDAELVSARLRLQELPLIYHPHGRPAMGADGFFFRGQAALEGDITVSRSVSDRDDQTGSLSREPLTPASCRTVCGQVLVGRSIGS